MELKDYIGKEVEVTLQIDGHTSCRIRGKIILGEYKGRDRIFLRHNNRAWSGTRPTGSKGDGYYYWVMFGLVHDLIFFKDIKLVDGIKPIKCMTKHSMTE